MAKRYEIIQSLGRNLLTLIQARVIPMTILDYKTYYEEYLDELQTNNEASSKKIISTKHDISLRKVQRIVEFMEENTSVKQMS
jgi:hypothetical protein